MIKTQNIIIIIILLLSFNVNAQSYKITGKVEDMESGKILAGANVELFRNNISLTKKLTDSLGDYSILLGVNTGKLIAKISKPGYELIVINVDLRKADEENKVALEVARLKPKAILLNEVVIKRSKKYRDTTVIDLSKETFKRFVMIDDLFSQKGLSKSSDGKLYYKGKLVSDIVVNGDDFFGKNNMTVYDKIPALILNNIEIVETNIDSITNTTLLAPNIKINLKIKDGYEKGKFGSASLGVGTHTRHIVNTDLYAYKKRQQMSLAMGLNNIGMDQNLGEPVLGYSVSGNNYRKEYLKYTYKSVFLNKIELNFSSKITNEDRVSLYELERNEESIKQFSKTRNSSAAKSFQVEDLGLNILYTIDTLNSLQLNSNFFYNETKGLDTLSYYIESDATKINTTMGRLRRHKGRSLSNSLLYEMKFHKKGRLFHLDINADRKTYNINELANFIDNNDARQLEGDRLAVQNKSKIVAYYTEPVGDNSYMKLNASVKNDAIYYSSFVRSISSRPTLNKLINNYIQSGFTFQKTLNKLSLLATANIILNKREITDLSKNSQNMFNPEIDIKVDKRISTRKRLMWNYNLSPRYPDINQLTNLNGSFDLVSQMKGNITLRPEVKHTIGFVYDFKKSDSLNLFISAESNYYFYKFGNNLSNLTDETPTVFTDNVGQSKSMLITFLASKIFPHAGTINYNLTLNYNEQPNIINSKRKNTTGIIITQALSTKKQIIDDYVLIAPTISLSLNRYYYENIAQNSANVTYSGTTSLNLLGFEINTYPIIRISRAKINNSLNWGINSEVRRKIFNNYGFAWIKAYDIFNSFNAQFNSFGPSYTQTVKYSNFTRYFLLGLSLKFNNIH